MFHSLVDNNESEATEILIFFGVRITVFSFQTYVAHTMFHLIHCCYHCSPRAVSWNTGMSWDLLCPFQEFRPEERTWLQKRTRPGHLGIDTEEQVCISREKSSKEKRQNTTRVETDLCKYLSLSPTNILTKFSPPLILQFH